MSQDVPYTRCASVYTRKITTVPDKKLSCAVFTTKVDGISAGQNELIVIFTGELEVGEHIRTGLYYISLGSEINNC